MSRSLSVADSFRLRFLVVHIAVRSDGGIVIRAAACEAHRKWVYALILMLFYISFDFLNLFSSFFFFFFFCFHNIKETPIPCVYHRIITVLPTSAILLRTWSQAKKSKYMKENYLKGVKLREKCTKKGSIYDAPYKVVFLLNWMQRRKGGEERERRRKRTIIGKRR